MSEQSPPNWTNFFLKQTPDLPLNLENLHTSLRGYGCHGCNLGKQKKLTGPVLYRGNPLSKIMIVGESPGMQEDESGRPFIGPAGKKLDQVFNSINLDTNSDCYLTNVVLCRPIAPTSSGKQNLAPEQGQVSNCRPYLIYQINVIQPKVIILAGMVAAKSVLPTVTRGKTMADLVGKFFTSNDPDLINNKFFIIYHPSAIIRSEGNYELNLYYRKVTWENMKTLKEFLKGE